MSGERIVRLRVSLEDWEPEIWRTVEVPADASLKMLHDVIQAAMGWQDYHLWAFEAGEQRYGIPDPDWPEGGVRAAKSTKLGALLDRGVRELIYTYDMGDDWRHIVTVEWIGDGAEGKRYPRLVDGARRCPPEDVGGLPGFEAFLEAISDPAHEEHADVLEWHGGPFDPDAFDPVQARLHVAAIAKNRAAGKARWAKGK